MDARQLVRRRRRQSRTADAVAELAHERLSARRARCSTSASVEPSGDQASALASCASSVRSRRRAHAPLARGPVAAAGDRRSSRPRARVRAPARAASPPAPLARARRPGRDVPTRGGARAGTRLRPAAPPLREGGLPAGSDRCDSRDREASSPRRASESRRHRRPRPGSRPRTAASREHRRRRSGHHRVRKR